MKKALSLVIATLLFLTLSLPARNASAKTVSYFETALLARDTNVKIGKVRIGSEDDGQTSVVISLNSGVIDNYIPTVNAGGCGGDGSVIYELDPMVDGLSVTVLKVDYKTFTESNWQIVLAPANDGPQVAEACGDSAHLDTNYEAELKPVNGSDVGGAAFIQHTDIGSKETEVNIFLESGDVETTYAAGWYSGTCEAPGKLRATLLDVEGGKSETILAAPVWELADGMWHIAIISKVDGKHEQSGTSAYVACGNGRPGGKGGMPSTDLPVVVGGPKLPPTGPIVGMPKTGRSEQSDEVIIVLAMLALGMIGTGARLTLGKAGSHEKVSTPPQ